MTDTAVIGLRLALYLATFVAFGLAASVGSIAADDGGARRIIAAAALAGVILSVVGVGGTTAAMTGTDLGGLDSDSLSSVLDTAFGVAAKVRIAALAATVGFVACSGGPRLCRALAVVASATAVASLAWNGHGASEDGVAGVVHLGADIFHLLAAAVWFGALIGLTRQAARADTADRIAAARLALSGFATTGTVVVVVLTVTGAVNVGRLVGFDEMVPALATPYGQLLLAKLVVFAAMLGLAARHRFALVPAMAGERSAATLMTLRRSLVVETLAAVVILVLVAMLGMLAPPTL